MITVNYANKEERQIAINEQEANGLVMLHDDFISSGGRLTFDLPKSKTDEQLAEEAETKALASVDTLIDQIDSLLKARVFLKRLCARLIKKGYLP